jgi:hypothetical protein
MKYYSVFAQAYGEGNYGDCTYNATTGQCVSAGGTAGGNSGGTGGGLANTGITLVALLTLACLIIFVSLIVRAWKRKPVPQPVEVEELDEAAEKRLSDRF